MSDWHLDSKSEEDWMSSCRNIAAARVKCRVYWPSGQVLELRAGEPQFKSKSETADFLTDSFGQATNAMCSCSPSSINRD